MCEKKNIFPRPSLIITKLFPNFSKKVEFENHFSMIFQTFRKKNAKKSPRHFYVQDFWYFVSAETQSISAEIFQFQLKKNLQKNGAFFQTSKKVFSLLYTRWKYPLRTLFKNFSSSSVARRRKFIFQTHRVIVELCSTITRCV